MLDHGEVIETPDVEVQPTAALKPAKATKLRDVLPQWKASKARKSQTVQAAEKALALYEASTGNLPIASLTRAQGVDMRAFLLAGGNRRLDGYEHVLRRETVPFGRFCIPGMNRIASSKSPMAHRARS